MRKRIVAAILLLLLFTAQAVSVLAAPPSRSYTYNTDALPVASPNPYTFTGDIDGVSYGIGKFSEPEDFVIDSENFIYLLDSGNKRIVVFNGDMELVRVISDISYKGEQITMKAPTALYIYEYFDSKLLYVADTENSRIFRIDLKEQLHGEVDVDAPATVDRMYGKPSIDIIAADTPYYPAKFIVDRAERIYVLGRTINRGIIKLTKDGAFDSFFGAPDVSYTFTEKIWRMLSTQEQLDKSYKFVPTEYSNIAQDSRGFTYVTLNAIARSKIYATFFTEIDDDIRKDNAVVKKLAADGTDILVRHGYFPPVGDISIYDPSAVEAVLAGMSSFVDVCVNDYDVYTIIDDMRCKVFTYDNEGNLLFVFGGSGTQDGTFQKPVAVSYFKGNQIAILDKRTASISFFTPTDYGNTILTAVEAYQDGEYEKSEELWSRVLEMNSNMTQAYSGAGKSLLRAGEYKKAMEYFRISKNKEYYSKALEQYIGQIISDKFTYIFLILVLWFLLSKIWKLIKRFRRFLREGVKKVV